MGQDVLDGHENSGDLLLHSSYNTMTTTPGMRSYFSVPL